MAHTAKPPAVAGYLIPEEDFGRLLRMRTVAELLAQLSARDHGDITVDHLAAVAEYLVDDARLLIERSRIIRAVNAAAAGNC
jgi:hypothetical protein